jgi:hypothetical protein
VMGSNVQIKTTIKIKDMNKKNALK